MTQDILTPAKIGEYLSHDQCSRFFKHRVDEVKQSENHSADEYDEAFTPLNLLLSEGGELFEQGVKERFEKGGADIVDLADGKDEDDEFDPDHQSVIDELARYINRPEDAGFAVLFQPTLKGEIAAFDIAGHADFVVIWPTDDGASVRVIDAKSTANEKSYQQIQAAIYTRLIEQAVEKSDISDAKLSYSAGVITREAKSLELTPDTIPSFDYDSRITDVTRMLQPDGDVASTGDTDLGDAPHAVTAKCSQCPYTESCTTEAFEEQHVRILGLTESEQAILEEYDITTIAELADLCREPDKGKDEWDPTTHKRAAGVPIDSAYHELKSDPKIGDQLPNLVYRAQAVQQQIESPDEYQTGLWIPGTGKCHLPEDDPYDPSEAEFDANSMVRVYLNVQHDHLRDRVIQLNARVSVSDDNIDSVRISELAEEVDGTADTTDMKWAGIPEKTDHESERELLRRFIERVNTAIESVAEQVKLSPDSEQQHPLLQFYTYTESELDALVEAINRVSNESTPLIDAFADTIEGRPEVDTPRVAHIKPELKPRFAIPTPSYGLLHVFDLMPPLGEYRKPKTKDEWTYTPPHAPGTTSVDVRTAFQHRLFNTERAWGREGDNIDVDPTEYPETKAGLKTRYRFGAEIPLGYLWSAVGRIDEQWIDDVETEISDKADHIKSDINSYLYHDPTERDIEIRSTDVNELGKHMVDMLEHVERAAVYRKESITERKPEVDPAELWTDTRETATVASAAREYLAVEHTTQQQERHDLYRKLPRQRILSGESLPVKIKSIDPDAGGDMSVVVTGELPFDHQNLFDDNADDARLVCKRKGKEKTSGGDRMVANQLELGASTFEAMSPKQIEMGTKATIWSVDLKENKVTFELRNTHWSWRFGSFHRNYTFDAAEAKNDHRKMHIERNQWLILDPSADNFPADRADKALETADQNAVHNLIEGVRWGDDALRSTMFDPDDLEVFADWLHENIGPNTYPNDRQQNFITTAKQVGLLQGPPGTGKTAGTIAPTICGRLFAAGQTGQGLSGLITAPSNTAVDEMLADTAELIDDLAASGVHGISPETVDIVRITREEPANPEPGVEYLHYQKDDDAARIREIRDQLRETDTAVVTGAKQNKTPTTDGGGTASEASGQATIGVFDETTTTGTEVVDNGPPASEVTHTLVFTTPTSSWGLLRECAGSNPDPEDIAEQSFWDLMVADEASMLTLPKLILAGAGMKRDGQLLLGGDHRQLPPVQKYDWEDNYRQSIAEAAPYLSALNYFRLLSGDLGRVGVDEADVATDTTDVLTNEQREQIKADIDPETNPIPLVQLNTTFRFGPETADFIGNTVYEKDGIDYSATEHDSVPTLHTADTKPLKTVYAPAPITVITYDAEETYQQVNEIEGTITNILLMNHSHEATAGVVTPHNAQRTRVRENIDNIAQTMSDPPMNLDAGTQVETVNRFQGGQKDMMIVSATASNPQFIRSESDFLLELNRANVAFSRHQHKLIAVMSESLLSHIPEDPAVYDESLLWKSLSNEAGEPPTTDTDPDWNGTLTEFLAPISPADQQRGDSTDISIYHLN